MKVSELITQLTNTMHEFGDLDVSLLIAGEKSKIQSKEDSFLLGSDEVFVSYERYEDGSEEIEIRSFIY